MTTLAWLAQEDGAHDICAQQAGPRKRTLG
jgi:hypothetical protein